MSQSMWSESQFNIYKDKNNKAPKDKRQNKAIPLKLQKTIQQLVVKKLDNAMESEFIKLKVQE